MRKLLVVFVICYIPISYSNAQADFEKTAKGSKKAIIRITTYDQEGEEIGRGKGFFINSEGTALSNYFFFDEFTTATIEMYDGHKFSINKIDAYIEKSDIAKFSINDTTYGPFPFISIEEFRPIQGADAFIISDFVQENNNYISGVLSTVREVLEIGLILLTTVPIEEEHAGLPLMNGKGNVVGIISFPLIKRYDLNFAMSIENLAYLTTIKETNPKEGDSLDQQTFTGVDSNELVELRKKYGEYYDSLKKYELRLQEYGGEVIDGRNMIGRLDAVTDFIPLFVRVLKYPGSYLYPFDSLTFLTKLIPPDNSFRLFNWTFKFSDGSYRYYGAIQLNNTEELKLIPLYDKSANLKEDIEDTILTNESWFGAQYYDIAQTNYKKKKYYILLGWNGNDQVSHKKVIEILTFEDEKPVFGAAIFKIGKRSLNNKYRKIFEYNSNAIVALKYEPEKNCIVFDHLVPPDAKSEGKTYTYIPDGSYNFYKIKKGRLIFYEGWLEHAKDPGKLRQE